MARTLLGGVRDDWSAHGRNITDRGFHSLAVYRYGVWARGLPPHIRTLGMLVYALLYSVTRNVYGVELPLSARIGRHVRMPHGHSIVVAPGVVIGDGCLIRQNVTIGAAHQGRLDRPEIGAGVEFGAGAVVIGGITVGDGARIGPNAVVMTDVPAGASAFSAPAKIMNPIRSRHLDAS